MDMKDRLLEEARRLSDEDRWESGRALLADLDEASTVDPEVASEWLEIALKRLAAYDAGDPAVPLNEAWRGLFDDEFALSQSEPRANRLR